MHYGIVFYSISFLLYFLFIKWYFISICLFLQQLFINNFAFKFLFIIIFNIFFKWIISLQITIFCNYYIFCFSYRELQFMRRTYWSFTIFNYVFIFFHILIFTRIAVSYKLFISNYFIFRITYFYIFNILKIF